MKEVTLRRCFTKPEKHPLRGLKRKTAEQATAPSPDFKQEDLFVSFIRNQRVCTNKKQLR
jgi:hypothetical protein